MNKTLKAQIKIGLILSALAVLIMMGRTCHAQKPWKKLDMDSSTFVLQYGTLEQYGYQKSIEQKSSHKLLCVLVGSKATWLYNLAYYIGTKNFNVSWDEPEGYQGVVITATAKIYTTNNPPTIKVKAPYTDELQTKSVTITGPADDVINIFIGYWELTGISLNELKSKKAVTKEFASDKVSFTWLGANPTIVVTKNPNAPVDLFKLKN